MSDTQTDRKLKFLYLFKVAGGPDTPVKDALKLSLIALSAVALGILSLSAFVQISR
jgi:hypothetical protein